MTKMTNDKMINNNWLVMNYILKLIKKHMIIYMIINLRFNFYKDFLFILYL